MVLVQWSSRLRHIAGGQEALFGRVKMDNVERVSRLENGSVAFQNVAGLLNLLIEDFDIPAKADVCFRDAKAAMLEGLLELDIIIEAKKED